MKRKINKIKSLMLTIAASSLINWAILILLIIAIASGFEPLFFKVMCFILWVELMLMDVNTYYWVETEDDKEPKEPIDKVKAMTELQNLYQQLDSMPDVETKKVIEELVKQKEKELAGELNG